MMRVNTKRTSLLSQWTFAICLMAFSLPAAAMFKCVNAKGSMTYQQEPCANDQQEQAISPAVKNPSMRPSQQASSQGATVGQLVQSPTPGLEGASACVKEYDAELTRQGQKWQGQANAPRDPADTEKLLALKAACPELNEPTASNEAERAANAQRLTQLKAREKAGLEQQLAILQQVCSAKETSSQDAGKNEASPSADVCNSEKQRIEAAISRLDQ